MRQGGSRFNRHALVNVLNDALATEIVCVGRFKRHEHRATEIGARKAAFEFTRQAIEEQGHADRIAEGIERLGGEANLAPKGLSNRDADGPMGRESLDDMIIEDLVVERICIDTYCEILDYLGDKDPATRAMLKKILVNEREHSEDLASLLQPGAEDPLGGEQ
jgi:bacterioferritin